MKKTLFVLTILGTGLGLGLSACGTGGGGAPSSSQEDPILNEIRNLSYDPAAKKIVWANVKDAANGYVINIDNGLDIEVPQSVGSLSYSFDSEGNDFAFSIEALIGERGSATNPKKAFTFQNTGDITNIAVEDGKITWDEVSGIQYLIESNGTKQATPITTNEYKLTPGTFNIRVRTYLPESDTRLHINPYYSSWSQKVDGRLLAVPENLKFADGNFSWKAVANATSYSILLGDQEHEVFSTTYSAGLITADMDVQVKANGDPDRKTYDSAWSESKTYKYIPPIDTLRVEDGTLKWDKPEGAVGYKIKVNGIEEKDILKKEEYGNFRAGSSTTVQILPVGDTDLFYSTWSNLMTITLLRSPSLSFDNNTFRWNQVQGAEGYTVRVTEVETGEVSTTKTGVDTFVFNYDFEQEGTYTVEVKANVLSTGTGFYDSKYSNAITVKKLSEPRNPIVTNQPLEANQVMIQTGIVSNASKYFLYADDVKIKESTQPQFNIDVSELNDNKEEVVIKMGIQAIGSFNTTSAYIDSEIREFNITKLAAPKNVAINGGIVTWDAVTNAEKYIVSIDGQRTEVLTNRYQLTDLAEGQHSIYVQSEGNGQNVVTSSHSNVLTVTKLAKPTIAFYQRAKSAGGDFYVEWQSIVGATAYNVKIGSNVYDASTNSYIISDNLDKFAIGQGTQLSVFAIGDGTNTIDGDASNTITILRYAAPTNLSLVTDNLQWDAPTVGGIVANDFTLNVKHNGGSWSELPQTITGNKVSLSEFEAGDYVVQVRANGNIQATTVDSDYSSQFSFTKLGDIENITRTGHRISWDQVAGNLGYEVKIAGETIARTLPANQNYIDVDTIFTKAGTYGITIKAIGDNATIADGKAYTFNQVVTSIPRPEKASGDVWSSDNLEFKYSQAGDTMTFTMEETELATGYRLLVGGVARVEGANPVMAYTMDGTASQFTFNVQYIGGVFADEPVSGDTYYYIDSNFSSAVTIHR